MWKCPECDREFRNVNQSHYCGNTDTIDGYIANQPVEVQPLLHKIRESIRQAAPDAIEKISWQMPTFWQNGYLIHFAAFKKHIGIYAGGEATAAFADRLLDYKTAKGTIRLPIDKPVPYDLIAEITKWRISEIEGRGNNE